MMVEGGRQENESNGDKAPTVMIQWRLVLSHCMSRAERAWNGVPERGATIR